MINRSLSAEGKISLINFCASQRTYTVVVVSIQWLTIQHCIGCPLQYVVSDSVSTLLWAEKIYNLHAL